MRPVLLVIAGPNGSGKTTVTGAQARLCARVSDGALRKIYGPLPSWVQEAVSPLPKHREFVDLRVA